MKKLIAICAGILALLALATACTPAAAAPEGTPTPGAASAAPTPAPTPETLDKIVFAFYPNESAAEYEGARNALKEEIEAATGIPVEIVTTTDYNIAIEAIASGQAHIAYMGAEGYIQAQKKNANVKVAFTNSGASGTDSDALYFSFIAVPADQAETYKDGTGYSIQNIKGKVFSFVSNNSTSGFKVPSAGIVSEFNLNSTEDLLLEGTFFKKVLFGGSHQGSAVNLLKGDADAAAFMNMPDYFEVAGGEENKAGMIYRVKQGAPAPFDTLAGKEALIIRSTPVLNAPFAVNLDVLPADVLDAIVAHITSDAVAKNQKIFAPADAEVKSFFKASSGNERFIVVPDEWYDPIREMA